MFYRGMLSAFVVVVAAISPTVRAGVYAHYSFNVNYADGSGNGRDGSLIDNGTLGNSGITTTAGEYKFGGGALSLSNDRDYVAVPSTTFGSGTPFTIAFWARKSETTRDWNMAIGQRDTDVFFIAPNRTGYLRWRGSSKSDATRQADFSPIPNDTHWHHYAIVADGTDLSCYRDGSLLAIGTGKQTGFTYDTIGEAYLAANSLDFRGQIDEVWILDEAARPEQVQHLYTFNAPCDTLLDMPCDVSVADTSPLANHGTANGAAAITTIAGVPAFGEGALRLTGADDTYVTLDRPIVRTATMPWTIAFWATRGETGDQKGMVMGELGTSDDFIWLNDSFTGFRFRSSTSATTDFTVTKDTARHHYCLVADGGGNLTLYVDGALNATKSGNSSFTLEAIGLAYPTASLHYAFQGTLDEIKVFDRAVGANEAARLAAVNEPTDLLLRYRFDGNFADSSGNANDGSPIGSPSITSVDGEYRFGPGGLELDGASRIDLTSTLVFSTDDAWSASFWARLDAISIKGMVMGENGTSDDFLWLNCGMDPGNGQIGLRFRDSGNTASQDLATPIDTKLHHYVLVANGARGGIDLYLDGGLTEHRVTTQTDFRITSIGAAYGTGSHHFDGTLDEVNVFSGCLDARKVHFLYSENVTEPTRGTMFLFN